MRAIPCRNQGPQVEGYYSKLQNIGQSSSTFKLSVESQVSPTH